MRYGLHISVALLGLVCSACHPASQAGKASSQQFRDAYSNGVEALEWANRYRASGPALFEPRYLDAEKAAQQMWLAADHNDQRQHDLALQVRSCMKHLEAYRKPLHGIQDGGGQETDLDRAQTAGAMLDNCIVDVKKGL